MEIQKNSFYQPQQNLQQLNHKTNNTLDAQKLETKKVANQQQQAGVANKIEPTSKPDEAIALNISKEGQALAAGGTPKVADTPPADANKVSYAGAVGNTQGNIKSQLENLQKRLSDNQTNSAATPRVNSLFR